ncbi:MAG: hypothetical protein SVY15_07530 [Halobacteriota archaeon]|nr:hypothetical protein [Halobacteriota archaeon]
MNNTKKMACLITVSILMAMIFASAPAAMACDNSPCDCSCDCDIVKPCERGAVRGTGDCGGRIRAVATEFSNGKVTSRGSFVGITTEGRLRGVLVVDDVDAEDGELSGMAHIRGYSDPVKFKITTMEECGRDKITLCLDLCSCVSIDYTGSANFDVLFEC